MLNHKMDKPNNSKVHEDDLKRFQAMKQLFEKCNEERAMCSFAITDNMIRANIKKELIKKNVV